MFTEQVVLYMCLKMCRYLTKNERVVPLPRTDGLNVRFGIKTSFCDNNSVLNGLLCRPIDAVEISFHFTRLQAVEGVDFKILWSQGMIIVITLMTDKYISRYFFFNYKLWPLS